jgi:hypothetical protein
MSEENVTGPTILWTDLDDVKVKSNDGQKLGKIKKISANHFRVEKGSLKKTSYWVPKNLADVYDGEYLWLSNNEEEIQDKFLYGEEPSNHEGATSERIKVVKERMKGIPSRQDDTSARYKNVRDLK